VLCKFLSDTENLLGLSIKIRVISVQSHEDMFHAKDMCTYMKKNPGFC